MSNSSAVIVFLTGHVNDEGVAVSDYMKSNNCLVELRAAAAHARPVILLLETDPTHGGVSLETHTAACPADLLPRGEPRLQLSCAVPAAARCPAHVCPCRRCRPLRTH